MNTRMTATLAAVLALAGCATSPESFTPADPEMMQEWQVEGSMEIERDNENYTTFFTWTQFGDQYQLELRPDSTVGPVSVTLRGTVGNNDVSMQPGDALSGAHSSMENLIRSHFPLEHMSFWLRGLPATENARVTESGVRRLDTMEEAGWQLDYGDFMYLGTYQMPEDITISGKSLDIALNIVRGEADIGSPLSRNVRSILVA